MVVQKVHPSEEIMYTVLLWRPLLQLYKWVLYFLCFWMQAANVFKWQDISWPDSTCISGCSVSFQEALGSRPAVIKATQHAASASEPSSLPAPQKVEGTKDLFDLLSLESDSNTATNDNEWAAFQCQCVLLISCPYNPLPEFCKPWWGPSREFACIATRASEYWKFEVWDFWF